MGRWLLNAALGAVLAGIVAAVVLSRMPGPGDPIVDTWPVGARACSVEAGRCDELVRVGLAGFDERNPGHAAVVSAELHVEGTFVDPSGDRILVERSGACCSVLVMTLADGTTRAIGVGYPGISQTAMAIPWEQRP